MLPAETIHIVSIESEGILVARVGVEQRVLAER
jgi:hypothetical protein